MRSENRPPAELASASGKEAGVQRESHPAKVQPTDRKPTAQATPALSEPVEDGHLKLRKLKVEKLRP
ncbi:MAG: hypothetical protein GY795_48390 [Desulfobacterales bacterium]|nr:hypothetical protein [Desulfobacterales bacterium]